MIRTIRDPYKLSMFLAIVFIVAILISAYKLYSLPADLMLPGIYGSALAKTYFIVAMTFIIGAVAIYLALKSRREIVVYKEKSNESLSVGDSAETQKSNISLESVRNFLDQQGGTNKRDLYQNFIQAVCKHLQAGQGAVYTTYEENGRHRVALKGGYALGLGESATIEFEFGEGLVGQAAASGQSLYVDDIPQGYIKVISGLGSASPRYLLIVPVKDQSNVVAVIEIASFTNFSEEQREYVESAAQLLADKMTSK